MTNNTEQQAVPVAQDILKRLRRMISPDGRLTFAAANFEDIGSFERETVKMAIDYFASLPCKSGEGAGACEDCKGTGYSGGVIPSEPELSDACEVCLGEGVLPNTDATQTREAELVAVAWCSPGQLANLMDVDADGGVYLPIRKSERGNFTMPLYSRPLASEKPQEFEVISSEKFLSECEDEAVDLLDVLADCDNLVLFNGTQADGWWEVRRSSMNGEIRGRGPTPKDALRAALSARDAA